MVPAPTCQPYYHQKCDHVRLELELERTQRKLGQLKVHDAKRNKDEREAQQAPRADVQRKHAVAERRPECLEKDEHAKR